MKRCARDACNAWVSHQNVDGLYCVAHTPAGRFVVGSKAQARAVRQADERFSRQKVCAERDCDNVFVPKKQRNIYCSAGCRNRGNARTSIARRSDMLRGRGAGKGYTKREGYHEHRLVMERTLGRTLRSDEVVHHRDGNRRNNELSNLEVLTRSAHSTMHSTGGCSPGCACRRHLSTACKPGCICKRHQNQRCAEGCQCNKHKPSWNSKRKDVS